MLPPGHSLVRYDNPVLVSRTEAALKGAVAGEPAAKKALDAKAAAAKKLPPVVDEKGRQKAPTQTEDILNSILPPRWVSARRCGRCRLPPILPNVQR
jgi:dynein light intermediate chain, axonemal